MHTLIRQEETRFVSEMSHILMCDVLGRGSRLLIRASRSTDHTLAFLIFVLYIYPIRNECNRIDNDSSVAASCF
jgi:hypothetical protein